MPSNSKNRLPIPLSRRVQISDSHCGPAVVQMLLESCGVSVSQDQIVQAAGISQTIEEDGSRVDQLAHAVTAINPNFRLYYQEKSTISDLDILVNQYQIPVAVEWQGLFEDDIVDNEDLSDDEANYGHYSIISTVDNDKKELVIVDPYKDFINQDRIFTFGRFQKRWWDTNEVIDDDNNSILVVDKELLFIIQPVYEPLPLTNLIPGEQYFPQALNA